MASSAASLNRGTCYSIVQKASTLDMTRYSNDGVSAVKSIALCPAANGEMHQYEVIYDPTTARFDVWRDGKYIDAWKDPANTLNSGSYISLYTNTTSAGFDDIIVSGDPVIAATFVDGLGRDFQSQTINGTKDIYTRTAFNSLGKIEKLYKAVEDTNVRHIYRTSPATVYQLLQYWADPLLRLFRFTHYNSSASTTISYDNAAKPYPSGNNYFSYEQVVDEKGSVKKIYYDTFGNKVIQSDDAADAQRTLTKYDALGRPTDIYTPNTGNPLVTRYYDWIINNKYNTLSQVVEKSTPDDSTTRYVYDYNGNLRFVQTAQQKYRTYGDDFTVYYYDAHNRVTLIGEEKDSTWTLAANPTFLANQTWAKEADEWKVRNTYDINQVTEVLNYCTGKLTMVELNDDLDAAVEHRTRYVYDKLGRLTEEYIEIDQGGILSAKVIKHVYDLQGREQQLLYPSKTTVVTKFDQVGRVEKKYTTKQ